MSTTVLKAPTGYGSAVVNTEFGNYPIGANGIVTVDSRVALSLVTAGFLMVSVVSGSHTVTAGEASANEVEIDTGLSTITSAIVQVLNAGNVATSDADVTWNDGILTIADGSTYNTVAGYTINYIVAGY